MSTRPADLTRADVTPTPRALEWCMHLLVVGLLMVAAARGLSGGEHGVAIVAAAVVCGVLYGIGPMLPIARRTAAGAAAWLGVVGLAWIGLVVLTPDAVWLAFPLYFLQLHLLGRRVGVAVVIVTTVVAITGFAAHQESFSPAMALGPALGAAVAVAVVWGYQALYRESERRRTLIEELTTTRAELAAAEHTAGVLAERDRLAREIHDTLAQGFSSIQLLLHAAERSLGSSPDTAVDYVVQARQAAGDNLAEARRFVVALSPPGLDDATVAAALDRLCATTSERHRVAVRFAVEGDQVPLPTDREVALLRIAQSALANTVQHADARNARIVLAYRAGEVELSVVDDGVGFDVEETGFGLTAMRARAGDLGGDFEVDSAAGTGTAVRVRLPLTSDEQVVAG